MMLHNFPPATNKKVMGIETIEGIHKIELTKLHTEGPRDQSLNNKQKPGKTTRQSRAAANKLQRSAVVPKPADTANQHLLLSANSSNCHTD